MVPSMARPTMGINTIGTIRMNMTRVEPRSVRFLGELFLGELLEESIRISHRIRHPGPQAEALGCRFRYEKSLSGWQALRLSIHYRIRVDSAELRHGAAIEHVIIAQ